MHTGYPSFSPNSSFYSVREKLSDYFTHGQEPGFTCVSRWGGGMAGAPVLGADLLVQCYLFTPTLLIPESLLFLLPQVSYFLCCRVLLILKVSFSSSPLFPWHSSFSFLLSTNSLKSLILLLFILLLWSWVFALVSLSLFFFSNSFLMRSQKREVMST